MRYTNYKYQHTNRHSRTDHIGEKEARENTAKIETKLINFKTQKWLNHAVFYLFKNMALFRILNKKKHKEEYDVEHIKQRNKPQALTNTRSRSSMYFPVPLKNDSHVRISKIIIRHTTQEWKHKQKGCRHSSLGAAHPLKSNKAKQ